MAKPRRVTHILIMEEGALAGKIPCRSVFHDYDGSEDGIVVTRFPKETTCKKCLSFIEGPGSPFPPATTVWDRLLRDENEEPPPPVVEEAKPKKKVKTPEEKAKARATRAERRAEAAVTREFSDPPFQAPIGQDINSCLMCGHELMPWVTRMMAPFCLMCRSQMDRANLDNWQRARGRRA